MRDVKAAQLMNLAYHLTRWSSFHEAVSGDPIPNDFRRNSTEFIKTIDPVLAGLRFNATRRTLSRLQRLLEREGLKWEDIADLSRDANSRFFDEIDMRNFFALTAWESEFYANFGTGWEAALARFPQITDDVTELSRCFALSRYPAAVFHSVQVLEAGLIELGKFLKVEDPYSGWTAVSRALSQAVKKEWKVKTAFERKNKDFLEQLDGTVQGLKNAWRNKISHSHGRLVLMTGHMNEQVAQEILFATRAFMRRLAEGLPPPKPRKKGQANESGPS